MKNKKLTIFIVILAIAILFVILDSYLFIFHRITTLNTKYVYINDLTSSASKYSDTYICTSGLYESGFEHSSLIAGKGKEEIWISTDIRDSFFTNIGFIVKIGYRFLGGDISSRHITTRNIYVCGIFQTGGRFGHMGQYPYRIIRSLR